MFYFSLVLIPPTLYALCNLLDKVLVHGEGEDAKESVLMAIGGFFNLLISVPILLLLLYKSNFVFSLPLFLNGILFSVAIYIYLFILKTNDVDRVVPWFQTIPVFGLIGGIIFLAEIPTKLEFLGIFLILCGGVVISMKKGKLDKNLIFIMLLSSLLIAVNDVVFAFYGRDMSVTNALFSDMLGKGIIGLAFLVIPNSINGFKVALRTKFGMQSLNEIIFILADAMFDVAKLFVPVVIVQAFASTQPVFVFIGSFFLKKKYPKFILEEEDNRSFLRIIGIILFIVGGIFLSFNI